MIFSRNIFLIFAEKECKIMFVEPAGTINTGDAGGDLTASENEWI